MGDRVLVQFKNSGGAVSPVCYLHWRGLEAPGYIRECAKLMEGRGEDLSYAFARFIGICHTKIDGNASLGCWNQDVPLEESDSHGDAGCYLVHCGTWDVEAFGGYGTPFNALRPAPRYVVVRTFGREKSYLKDWDDVYGTSCIGDLEQAMVFEDEESAQAAAERANATCCGVAGAPMPEGMTFSARLL